MQKVGINSCILLLITPLREIQNSASGGRRQRLAQSAHSWYVLADRGGPSMIDLNLQQVTSEIFLRIVNEPAALHDLLAKFENYSDALLVDLFKNG
jgi:hypothetical protein